VDYLIDINNFHGPLDLLLHLVKSKEQDIYEISTSVIIEEYLNYINTMKDLNIDVASEFMVMAATLIHLKSRMLLGSSEEETEEEQEFEINSEEDLKKRILEYEKYKKMTEVFKEMEEKRSEFYTKSPMSLKEFTDEAISNDGSVTIDDLVAALLAYKERINYQKPINTKITRRELSVEDQMNSIKGKLKVNKKMNFVDLFEEVNKEYLIVTFLAILQMSKNDEIMIYQDNNFDNIVVESR
jgi:segregation and condensation protein A